VAQTDAQVRASLAAKISVAAPNSVVFDYWPLGFQIADWPGILRSDGDSGRVRAWSVTRRVIITERLPGSLSRKKSTYAIWFFHYHDDTTASASEDSFSAELDVVINALSAEGSGEGLQVPVIDLFPFGSELLHVAQCEIVVTVC